jgi:phosphatidylserine decarboxylase
MPAAEPIRFYHRHTQRVETEQVYGEGFLRWAYERPLGRLALEALVKRALFSRWYGWRMDARKSAHKVQPFIQKYGLDPAEFAAGADSFTSFNDFFYRKLKPEARPIDAANKSLVFPADGRHLLLADISRVKDFFVKGQRFDLAQLLGSNELAGRYANGSALISRLCPVDYHRFHLPTACTLGQPRLIQGPLYSVSPIALDIRPSILWENKRYLTALTDTPVGELLYLEIGATCVGSVIHTSTMQQRMEKGAEKGYFRFGGSCVITLYPSYRVQWAEDLLEYGAQGMEVYARMGERSGTVTL